MNTVQRSIESKKKEILEHQQKIEKAQMYIEALKDIETAGIYQRARRTSPRHQGRKPPVTLGKKNQHRKGR